jgi:hypothetical protein
MRSKTNAVQRSSEREIDMSGRGTVGTLVLSLGPATIVVGLLWSLRRPYRTTFLESEEESFSLLAVQPPLLVVLAGVGFHLAIARGLVRDLLEAERRRGRDG